MQVLMIEDQRDIADNVADYLERAGHDLDLAIDGATGLKLALTDAYDVLIVDVMMPKLDGLELVRQLRASGRQTPALMLTARDSLDDKLAGFAAGADDYLVKPFAMPELLARLVALGRRQAAASAAAETLTIGDLTIEVASRSVTRAGQALILNHSAYQLLVALARSAPQPLSQVKLASVLWGADEVPGSDNALRSHLYLLRQVVDKPFDRPLIHTIRGVGIVLQDQP